MAVSKSTIKNVSFSSTPVTPTWSSLASNANNAYIDVKGAEGSKLILLVSYNRSTDVGTTAGMIYVGCSASASSGSCWARTYSGRGTAWSRKRFHSVFPTTDVKEALQCTNAGHLAISAIGPFETARFKDSNGYIKICKGKGTSDAGDVKICPILIS